MDKWSQLRQGSRARGEALRNTHSRDPFGHQRLREGKYAAGQIDAAWSAPIRPDLLTKTS